MKLDYKLTTILLVILGVLDLVAIPFGEAAGITEYRGRRRPATDCLAR